MLFIVLYWCLDVKINIDILTLILSYFLVFVWIISSSRFKKMIQKIANKHNTVLFMFTNKTGMFNVVIFAIVCGTIHIVKEEYSTRLVRVHVITKY